VDGIPNGKLSVSRSPSRQPRSISQITTARFFKTCFSACGEYVFVGSRMGQVHVWRSESGAYIGEYKNTLGGWPTTDSPIVDICFHPHDHVIAFSVWGEEEPVMVYTWDQNEADIKSAKSNGDLSSKKHLDVEKMVAKSLSSIANF
jgi:WD40 repeat protein